MDENQEPLSPGQASLRPSLIHTADGDFDESCKSPNVKPYEGHFNLEPQTEKLEFILDEGTFEPIKKEQLDKPGGESCFKQNDSPTEDPHREVHRPGRPMAPSDSQIENKSPISRSSAQFDAPSELLARAVRPDFVHIQETVLFEETEPNAAAGSELDFAEALADALSLDEELADLI